MSRSSRAWPILTGVIVGLLATAGLAAVDGLPSPISTIGGDQTGEETVEPDSLDSFQTAWCLPLLGIPLRIRRERVLDNANPNPTLAEQWFDVMGLVCNSDQYGFHLWGDIDDPAKPYAIAGTVCSPNLPGIPWG